MAYNGKAPNGFNQLSSSLVALFVSGSRSADFGVTSSQFYGSLSASAFLGNGAGLTNLSIDSLGDITTLKSGSTTAVISPNQGLRVNTALTVKDFLIVTGSTSIGDNLVVSGSTTLGDEIVYVGTGDLQISNNGAGGIKFNDPIEVTGNSLITGDLKNIEHLFKEKNFEFYHHDITKFVHVPGELDYILHFASPASPIDYLKIPIQTLKVGSLGTHNLLGLARVKKARILIASTSEIYGDPLIHPQTEEYYGNVNTIGPRGVYDEAKRFQESITMAYHTFHGVETRIVRIFNTYGPRMRLNDGRVIPAFIGQALRGEDLTIFGDGSQTRSFCYVTDQVEGIYRLLLSDYHLPVNIGNPDEITISDFAEEIIKLTGTNQKVIYKDLPVNDPMQRQPDITKAKEILGWSAKVNREEGMKITYEYFKSLSPEELAKEEHKDFSKYIY